jgi:hypothetical protein
MRDWTPFNIYGHFHLSLHIIVQGDVWEKIIWRKEHVLINVGWLPRIMQTNVNVHKHITARAVWVKGETEVHVAEINLFVANNGVFKSTASTTDTLCSSHPSVQEYQGVPGTGQQEGGSSVGGDTVTWSRSEPGTFQCYHYIHAFGTSLLGNLVRRTPLFCVSVSACCFHGTCRGRKVPSCGWWDCQSDKEWHQLYVWLTRWSNTGPKETAAPRIEIDGTRDTYSSRCPHDPRETTAPV